MTTLAGPRQPALAKGLEVLEAVLTNHRLIDIAATTGLTYGTVHRILRELVARGWVVQAPDRGYYPGPRQQGQAALLTEDGEVRLLPPLLRLREQTGLTAQLALLRGGRLIYAAKADGPAAYRMGSYVGSEALLHCTAMGKAVLAAMPLEAALARLSGGPVVRRTPRTVVSLPALRLELDRVRPRGWSVDDEENEAGTRCVGVALQSRSGHVAGAMSISGTVRHLGPDEIAAHLPALLRASRHAAAVIGSFRLAGNH